MNFKKKQVVIDALTKLVNSAPSMQYAPNNIYNIQYYKAQYDISKGAFDNWIVYINSVLDTLYSYSKFQEILIAKFTIITLSTQNNLSYTDRVLKIGTELLNLAKKILYS